MAHPIAKFHEKVSAKIPALTAFHRKLTMTFSAKMERCHVN